MRHSKAMKNIWLWLLGSSLLIVACAATQTIITPAWQVETVKTGLERPWSLNFAPDGRLLFSTRYTGVLQSLDVSSGVVSTFSTTLPNFRPDGEGGMMGLELDSQFAQNNKLYICYSYWKNGLQTDANKRNRLSSFVLQGKAVTAESILIDDMPGWWNHNGCRVVLSPDHQFLFVSMGDAAGQGTGPIKAQDLNSLGGKILRIGLDGSIPSDNPFANSPVWSLGHRNPQGLAFHPQTGALWSTEHGANTKDELNLIKKGMNYGWSDCEGVVATCNVENYQPAIKEYNTNDTIAISDMVFYTADAFPAWQNNLFFVTLKTGRLYRLELNAETIVKEEILIDNTYGRLRDITVGLDGFLYISTDAALDSRIIRIRPK
jgi:aldose sugar dehydrogenase